MTSSPIDPINKPRMPTSYEVPDKGLRVQQALAVVERGSLEGAPSLRREELLHPIQQINEVLRPYSVQFELAGDNYRVITRIVDMQNGELIRQIPAEAVLQVAERLDELPGLLLEQKA